MLKKWLLVLCLLVWLLWFTACQKSQATVEEATEPPPIAKTEVTTVEMAPTEEAELKPTQTSEVTPTPETTPTPDPFKVLKEALQTPMQEVHMEFVYSDALIRKLAEGRFYDMFAACTAERLLEYNEHRNDITFLLSVNALCLGEVANSLEMGRDRYLAQLIIVEDFKLPILMPGMRMQMPTDAQIIQRFNDETGWDFVNCANVELNSFLVATEGLDYTEENENFDAQYRPLAQEYIDGFNQCYIDTAPPQPSA